MYSRKFPKKEHLKSKKQIQALFHSGKAFSVFPFRVIYLLHPSPVKPGTAHVGFSVPSRHYKKAVDRNRIKRQMREAYRLQKKDFLHFLEKNRLELSVFFIYTGKKLPQYPFLFKKMGVTLGSFMKTLQKQSTDESSQ